MRNVILMGKRLIGRILGAPAGKLHPERLENALRVQSHGPDSPRPSGPPPGIDPAVSNPSSVHRADPVPDSNAIESRISDGLRGKILACAFLRKSVEEEMVDVCKIYRKSMPPCRLQLFPWAFPKGSPVRTLYWVRLCKKRDDFDHERLVPTREKRPRWFKVLNIRSRQDLYSAIYHSYLSKHRKTVMSFYDRWRALNTSHSILARALRSAKLALLLHLRSSGPGKEVPMELLMHPFLSRLEGIGAELFGMAWKLGPLLIGTIRALEELAVRTEGLPLRLIVSKGPAEFSRFAQWEEKLTGKKRRRMYERSLKTLQLSAQELAALRVAVGERKVLLRTLSCRLRLFSKTETRLAKARRDSEQLLEQCAPVQPIPWIPGY